MNGQGEERVQVLVVGAGPAGLATALELATRGLAPLILERRPASGSHPRATALTAETMQLIRRWGAEPAVRRLGFGCEYAMSIRSCLTGPEIQRVPLDGHVWACAQDHLETILAQRATAAGARLRYGAELTGLHPAGQEMLATVAAAPGPPATIRARYVVGADGAHSAVRQATGITTSRARAFGDWISILFRAPLRDYTGDRPCLVYGIGAPSTGGVLVPTDPADRWIRGIPWHPEHGERLEDFDQQRCTALIRSAAGVPDLPVEITGIRAFTMTAAIADHYRAGRAVLAGDAAHVFTPATGMGLNLAIHDGTVLAQALATTIEHGDQPHLLDQYEQACKPLAEKLLEPELALAARRAIIGLTSTKTEVPEMIIRSPYADVELAAVSLHDFVLGSAAGRGGRAALIDGPTGRTLTYAQLAGTVRRAAAGLVAHGVTKGDGCWPFFLPVAMTSRAAMSRRLSSCPRR